MPPTNVNLTETPETLAITSHGSVLCEACRLIQLQPPTSTLLKARFKSWFKLRKPSFDNFDNYWCILHPSLESLRVSAGRGCHLCRMIFEGTPWWQNPDTLDGEVKISIVPHLRGYAPRGVYWRSNQLYYFQINGPRDPSSPHYNPRGHFELRLQGQYDFCANAGYLPPGTDGTRYHDPTTLSALCHPDPGLIAERYHQTGSPASIRLINAWLHHCEQHHEECSTREKAVPQLPTRIIDVEGAKGAHHPVLLVTSHGQTGHYLTLSHCWGQRPPLTTTQSTLSDRQTAIPLASMPQTFHDAVQVTRTLGFRYLWIDSLCILQDSEMDWELESSRMGDYYWNSSLTIAAAASTDAFQGLFRLRDTAALYPCTTSLQCLTPDRKRKPEAGAVAISFAPRFESMNGIFPYQDWRDIPRYNSSLSTRGWVLQEQILSRRVLSFEHFQVSFSCLKMRASETKPCGQARETTWLRLRRTWETPYLQCVLRSVAVKQTLHGGYDPESPHFRYDAWYDMLDEYSGRDLSKESDTLPALSGLANRFNDLFFDGKEEYLAGLWKGDLKRGLLWQSAVPFIYDAGPDPGNLPRRRAASHACPSWSPLSVKLRDRRGVTFCGRDPDLEAFEDIFTILSASTTVKGVNPYGQVVTASLKVRCRLRMVHVGFAQGPRHGGRRVIFDPDMKDHFLEFGEDVPAELDPFRNGNRRIWIPRYNRKDRIDKMKDGVDKDWVIYNPLAPVVACTPVEIKSRSARSSAMEYRVLVLTAVGSQEQKVYRRLGLGCISRPVEYLGSSFIREELEWFKGGEQTEITLV